MGKGYLIDTNALIDVQSNAMSENGLEFMAEIMNADFTISFVSYIEFLGYKHATESMHDFIALANVLEINKEIIDTTITIRKSRRIKVPDAIIAATAIVYNRTLISRDMIYFTNIPGLATINPWEK